MVRAAPMTLEERRAALVDATLPLLYQHGRGVTTRLIAEAAGVAEGTIFRAFGSKDELVDAAIEKAFEPGQLVTRLDDIDMSWPLEQRLVKLVGILQQRLLAVFGLMRTCGMVAPPAHDEAAHERWRRQVVARAVALGPSYLGGSTRTSVTTLVTDGLEALRPYLSKYLPQLLMTALVTPALLAVVLSQDLVAALTIAVTIPLVPLFMALVGWMTQSTAARRLVTMQRLGAQVLDLVLVAVQRHQPSAD